MMTSGARYSSVPTSELVRTLGCAASSMGLAALLLDRRLVELVRSMVLLLPLRPLVLPGGVPGTGTEAGAEGAGTSSGATLAPPVPQANDRSKSVSWQWPEGMIRMFSGFRSLSVQGARRGDGGWVDKEPVEFSRRVATRCATPSQHVACAEQVVEKCWGLL